MTTLTSDNCLICRKHRRLPTELKGPNLAIYEDELVYLSHAQLWGDNEEHYLGYLFLETKRHIAGLGEMTDAEAERIGLLTKRAAEALTAVAGIEHVYAIVHGDGVPHIHIHLIGRHRGTPREHYGFGVTDWAGAPRGDETAIIALSKRLRRHIA